MNRSSHQTGMKQVGMKERRRGKVRGRGDAIELTDSSGQCVHRCRGTVLVSLVPRQTTGPAPVQLWVYPKHVFWQQMQVKPKSILVATLGVTQLFPASKTFHSPSLVQNYALGASSNLLTVGFRDCYVHHLGPDFFRVRHTTQIGFLNPVEGHV